MLALVVPVVAEPDVVAGLVLLAAEDVAAADVAALGAVVPPELFPHPPIETAAIAVNTAIRIRITHMFAHLDPSSFITGAEACEYLRVSSRLRQDLDPKTLGQRLERLDPFWAPQLLVAATILLDLSLTDAIIVGPRWLLPALEGAALIGLLSASPHPRMRHSPLRRRLALALIGLVSAANTVSLVLLCRELIVGSAQNNGKALIGSGMVLWATNVLLFAVWYWQLDRGGPLARAHGENDIPDFLFVQMSQPDYAPAGWEPGVIDYLYTSFTNATAFSPTDTMPLTPTAKGLMTVQSLTALVTVGLVVARAVNIL